MDRYKFIILVLSLLSYCSCEISLEKKDKLVNGFIDFYNSLPNQIYSCDEGYMKNAQQSTEQNSYEIEIILKVSDLHNLDSKKYLRCTGKVVDLYEVGVSILNHHCEDATLDKVPEIEELEKVVTEVGDVVEQTVVRKPIQLDNEVQTDIAVTSGEQFIAIPREEHRVSCIGCSSHVNPQAPGVSDLAAIGVRQLDSLEPNVKHTLNTVVDVERQVQVVNGIRYMLTLIIDYNSCRTPETETCLNSKTCKITFLEKPWMQLPDGSKYRAILANNCTDEWQFGDDGVIIPNADNRENNNINASQTIESDVIKSVNNVDVQAQPHTEQTLTDEDLKVLQLQIIPSKEIEEHEVLSTPTVTPEPDETTESGKDHVVKVESESQLSPNGIPITNPVKLESLSEDKKKAIDDMLNFFNFAGIDIGRPDGDKTRLKRSFDKDLNIMNLLEKFQKVKKNVDNAKYIYKLAQIVVDYLNEMDLEVKTRVLKDVINAEEEFENHQHFYYIQSRVIIPCDKYECEERDTISKICNAVLDGTNKHVEILNVFCHDEPKVKPLGKVNSVPLDDPVLLKLVKEATDKIESETSSKAMKLNKIIDANTQRVSGTLTKFSIILDYTSCDKTVPLVFRSNCSIVEELGAQVCDVTVHERHWLKEKKLTYTCTERPVDMSFSNIRKFGVKKSVNDPAVLDMVNEALQYLDVQSNRNSKQIVVKVNSVATQLVAGFLTDIEFVVGYTTCTNDVKHDISKCKLLKDEPLRTCKAKVWDRTWIEDGRQVDVSCKEPNTGDNQVKKIVKRDVSLGGGPENVDLKSPEIEKLAKEALRKYLKNSVYNRHYTVIKIQRAITQIVSGTLTELEFKISPTTCLIDKEGNPPSSDCKIIDHNDVTICKSTIWEKKWLDFKEINTTCGADNENTRVKRGLLGAPKEEENPNHPKFQKLAEESMLKYLQSNGKPELHKIVVIEKVTTQVVAGTLTKIYFKITPVDQVSGDILNCESKILEQLWKDLKEITVNCNIDDQSRTKKQIPGGLKEENPNDPKFRKLAEESMHKYLQSNGNTNSHKILSIVKVTSQVVSGTLTHIDFKISPVYETTGDVLSCKSKIWEQPWTGLKEITVNCDIDGKFRSKREVNHESFTKRKLLNVGEETLEDVNETKFKTLAKESLQKFLKSSGDSQHYGLVSIEKVTVQVVSGVVTRLEFSISPTNCQVDSKGKPSSSDCKVIDAGDVIRCSSEILEREWLNIKDISVSCHVDDLSNRVKRNIFTGGHLKQDVNDPKYKKLAEESMQKYLQNNAKTHPHKIVSIDKVTTQVVSGILTVLKFKISPTDQMTADIITCRSEILEQTWSVYKEITVNCDADKHSRQNQESLAGGLKEEDPNDPHYRKLAEESMQKYLQSNGITNSHKILGIVKVATQVVSGKLTHIDFKISPVDETTGDVLSCKSEIWEQPWRDLKEITVNCNIDGQSRIKRNVLGGLKEEDPNDPHYRKLAEECMQKYLQSNGNTNSHKILDIIKVATQVVSGKLTHIDFKISPVDETTGDVLTCKSKIWEQPWRGSKEITVNCNIDGQSRTKRNVPGGLKEEDPNDPHYRKLAEECMQKYLQSNGNTNSHKILDIIKVATQVVSGKLTHIDFKISPVDETTGDVLTCKSKIWEQPWRGSKEITVNCNIDGQSRTKRNVPGGLKEEDPNDPHYRKLAEECMQKYLQSNGNTNSHKILDIIKVATQVVSGKLTHIDFKISPVDETTGDVLTCKSKIWEQPWTGLKEITVNCYIDGQSRTKRETIGRPKYSAKSKLMGGEQEQDPTKIQYKELAQESLKKYLKLQQNSNSHKVVEVKKVNMRIASGQIYTIEYVAAPEHCATDISTCADSNSVLQCHTEVWDQPWLGRKEIKVSCRPHNKKRKTRSLELKDVELTLHDEGIRDKRQTGPEDDYVDEDISFYYADRAIKQLNDQTHSNNLHKLITIHGIQNSMHMNQPLVRMYIETAETYCLRRRDENILPDCEELNGMNHQLCHVRLWPSSDDELVIKQVSIVCDDDDKFESVSGLSIPMLLKASIKEVEKSPNSKYKLVHQGEPQVIPTLDSSYPITINFIVASTNCSKSIQLDLNTPNNYNCFIDITRPSKACQSRIWLAPNSKQIRKIIAKCGKKESRKKRSVSLNPTNATADELIIQNLVKESLHKLEMASSNRYKQRVLQINSYSTKITSGRVTTIDFDVAYTSCLKFEWVDDEKTCEFLEHLPRRHCVSQVWERLWLENGRNIEVTCEEDETPLEAHVEFESAETATKLANEALRHIEAKYPHPRKQKVIRIFSLEKQVVAGIHYRMKIEIGSTKCPALSASNDCKLDKDVEGNKFCRVNVWLRPWTNHAPNFRVSCDYQEGATAEVYHLIQAEQLFHDFLTTYKPEYINDAKQMTKRFEIFKKNVRKMHEFNIYEKGTAMYGVTRFADLSYEEFSAKYLGLKPSLRDTNQVPMRQAEIPDLQIPEKFDWRDFDAVTEVKNQGSCGSCWAFSVTGNIEGQWKMQSGQLVSLSEQELVDCDKLDNGCNGGLPDNAYRAIEQLGGLELENDYPYEGEDDRCSFNKSMSRVRITGAVNITTNETGMAKWLVQNGPISIGINANAMQFYMGGVSHPWKMLCNPTNLDHGVLIVGYGVKDYPLFHKRLPYWTIKNSWGPGWGEQGYYRVFRGDGTCGVNQMASSAVI